LILLSRVLLIASSPSPSNKIATIKRIKPDASNSDDDDDDDDDADDEKDRLIKEAAAKMVEKLQRGAKRRSVAHDVDAPGNKVRCTGDGSRFVVSHKSV
jgi:hypothetical protein